jgi:S-methyl-5-thioribose-1-phosphate isomerase
MSGRTIDWSAGGIVLIDQTRLPEETVLLHVRTVEELIDAIRRLAVRGAMALGVAGAMGVALGAARAREAGSDVAAAARAAGAALRAARPTAVNLGWGVDRALAAVGGGAEAILAEALRVRDEDIAASRAIGARGADLLTREAAPPAGAPINVLTHCNAGALAGVEGGSALAAVQALHERGDLAEVFVAETRPLLQGARLTAWELARLGAAHRVIVDGAGAGLILGGRVDGVIVGADRIARNGDVANKVGTLAHALAAARAGVPFVVAAPEATIDYALADGAAIPIEERDPQEILSLAGRRLAPPQTGALNPAFDVTPAALVSAIVTEARVIRPADGPIPPPP